MVRTSIFKWLYIPIVRWGHDAENDGELTVRRGDEVEILSPGSKDILYKVLK